MTTDFYNLLLSDSALALVLLGLFWYVSRISRGLRGIALWGVAHLAYSVGASMLDGTAPEFARTGNAGASFWIAGIGGLLACAGLAGLAWSIILFVRQRALRRRELLLMPACLSFALLAWLSGGSVDAQGAAMSAAELLALLVMAWHLRRLDAAPDRLPARLMMIGCAVLSLLYARDLWQALGGEYGPNEDWVNIDLSTWYLMNFCMLMLTSFRATEPLRQSAMYDPLTGALNRRGLNSELAGTRHAHDGRSLAVIALDLDHFKSVNDRFGHQTGDLVLQRFSDAVRACIRVDDLFARLGGEEFVVVLPDARLAEARRIAERIREQVMVLELGDGAPDAGVTCSLGIGHADASPDVATLMRIADEALYEAKRQGRNRIEVRALAAT
ncbi:MAG: GGDEF domain-containing protein [Proteobacteria bacterium]|nr:GGDEF domain-containing protein [Pseudomonadota bacterium]